MPENPPVQTVPTTPTDSPPSPESSSFFRTLLAGIALILLGTFIGVLAARFIPMTSDTILPLPDNSLTPTPTVIEETITPTIEITPIPIPTATPSALLNLKWNMMTVKSPLTAFSDYKIYYPTTWTIKEYKNISKPADAGSSFLTLTKGTTVLNIIQNNRPSPTCDYSGNPEVLGEGTIGFTGDFRRIQKDSAQNWRWALSPNISVPEYMVCEANAPDNFTDSTSIGFINFSSEGVTAETLDEINYILEKIVILK